MASINLANIRKQYGSVTIIDDVSIAIEDQEFVVLVGPSGCGKSTLLRMIAGLESISGGTIAIDGEVVNDVGPQRRDLAMVFQTYALYPHMTTAQNIGFPLKLRGASQDDIGRSVAGVANTLHLDALLDRQPRALSGGQRQRVAMGRAMVREPRAFLFDEPLSNLDAKLRHHMRIELRQLHKSLGATSIYVTHDQIEAMTMADRIVVMNRGKVEQVGTPLELFDKPANIFVAGFLGSPTINLASATLSAGGGSAKLEFHAGSGPIDLANVTPSAHKEVVAGVRPQHLEVVSPEGAGLTGTVDLVEQTGCETNIILSVGSEKWTVQSRIRQHLVQGERVGLVFDPTNLHLFAAETKERIQW
ncbi:sn-glycerol-3-phosphate ABC transporter ATP-binding protein UgpC [Mesorhizobium sp. VK9D]|uniref:ABC transporter ATP-binding protein n=1 Tax=Mesorhizobium australafricanum TaxID=3072311 RepID=UPI002A23E8B7|nr:sn-glycerol-3-phosphate ABC transporter ATP-binding protein UgpC [Mesorhizobium sp. VK9D]MDX8455345.1 sn-glycerol-3-phosphate ABC transporter ATP-binding protein UgpC [Mesorhizobium sp. VK9D]